MKIYITPQAYLKLKYYALSIQEEISGLGIGRKLGNTDVLVEDIYCFKQKVNGVNTDLDKKDIADFYVKMHKAGKDLSEIRVWWHSHCTMAVSFSPLDDKTIDEGFKCDSYLISIVINHRLETEGRIDIFEPFRCTIEADVEIYLEDTKLQQAINAEVKEKVNNESIYTYPYNESFKSKKKQKKKKKSANKQKQQKINYNLPNDNIDVDELIKDNGIPTC